MKFERKLHLGKAIKRYKRFFVDFNLEGKTETAHNPNTGSMKTCFAENWDCAVLFHDDPKRKLKYSLELMNNGKSWIGVNTHLTNKLVSEALINKKIPSLSNYHYIRPEFKVGDSRIDFLLKESEHSSEKNNHYFLEVKNVSMLGAESVAVFPDAVTERGQKHLKELMSLKRDGYNCGIIFVAQREDVDSFRACFEIDPEYARLLKEASEVGVEILAYKCIVNLEEVFINTPLEIII